MIINYIELNKEECYFCKRNKSDFEQNLKDKIITLENTAKANNKSSQDKLVQNLAEKLKKLEVFRESLEKSKLLDISLVAVKSDLSSFERRIPELKQILNLEDETCKNLNDINEKVKKMINQVQSGSYDNELVNNELKYELKSSEKQLNEIEFISDFLMGEYLKYYSILHCSFYDKDKNILRSDPAFWESRLHRYLKKNNYPNIVKKEEMRKIYINGLKFVSEEKREYLSVDIWGGEQMQGEVENYLQTVENLSTLVIKVVCCSICHEFLNRQHDDSFYVDEN